MEQGNEKELKKQKEIAFYSALVNAWVTSRMEIDKSLLALSAGGIGLLVTLLLSIRVNILWLLILYGIAFLAFISTILITIKILRLNPDYIEQIVNEGKEDIKEQKKDEKQDRIRQKLDKLDSRAIWCFISGIIVSFFIGLLSVIFKRG